MKILVCCNKGDDEHSYRVSGLLLKEEHPPRVDLSRRTPGAGSVLISCLVRRGAAMVRFGDRNVGGFQAALCSWLHLTPIQPADKERNCISWVSLLIKNCLFGYLIIEVHTVFAYLLL